MFFEYNLEEISKRLATAIGSKISKARSAALFVKIALVAVGSAIVAIAQFAQFPKEGPTAWQLAGILASVVVAIGAIFSVMTDVDSSEEMAVAREALEAAREAQEQNEFFFANENALDRAINLYNTVGLMRGVLERTVINGSVTDDTLVQMLDVADRNLPIAFGFAQSDQWTVCIYKAHPQTSGRALLKCLAQDRAIKCNTSEARSWEEGIGVAGICYSNALEIIVPDLQANNIGSMFNIGVRSREYDRTRYRSIVAVPVKVDKMARPWGVIVATSDRPHHFAPDTDEGIKTTEAARGLAGMVALAVAVQSTPSTSPSTAAASA